MTRLPGSESLGGLPSARSGRPVASVDTTAVGRGIDQFGAAVSEAGARLVLRNERQRIRTESFDAERAFQQFRFGEEEAFNAAQRDLSPADAAGFAERWTAGYQERARTFFATVPEDLKPEYDAKLYDAEQSFTRQGLDFEHAQGRAYGLNGIADTLNSAILPRVARLPRPDAGYDAARAGIRGLVADAYRVIDAAPGLTAAEREEQKRQARQTIQTAYYDALPIDQRQAAVNVFPAGSEQGGAAPGLGPSPQVARTSGDAARVQFVDNTAGKIRNQPIAGWVRNGIAEAAAATGPNIAIRVVSGGQPTASEGTRRAGSTRHDHGNAADIVLVVDGKDVLPGENKELYARFFENAAAAGFTGLGHYSWGIHVGGGKEASWGPTRSRRTLDPEFGAAIERGRARARDRTGMVASPAGEPSVRRGDYSPVEYDNVRFFKEAGASPLAAAAIAAAFTTESSNRPDVVNSIGAGGLGQWAGARLDALKAFAALTGKPWQDADIQRQFTLAEMTGDPRVPADAGARRAWRELQSATTPEQAAAAMAHFERAEGYSPDNPQGIALWGKRVANTARLAGVAGYAPAGGGQPADGMSASDGSYTVGAGPTLLDAIPYEDRVKMARAAAEDMAAAARDAITAQQRAQNEELKRLQAEHDQQLNDLMVGIIDGNAGMVDVAQARRAGWLTDASEISRAMSAIEKRDKDALDAQAAIQMVTMPNGGANPYDAAARDLVDKGYQALGGAQGLLEGDAAARQRLDGVVANTGVIPKQAVNILRAGLISTDIATAMQAYATAARLAGANPRVFDPYDGGAGLRDAASAFTHLVDDRGFSPEDAVRQLQSAQTADQTQRERLLGPAAEKFVADLAPGDVTAAFDPGAGPWGLFSSDPASGYSPEMEGAMMADYREIAREKFLQTGDPGTAKAQALAEMHRLYGITNVGGAPALMKYPPEHFYPPIDGSQDYLRDAALKAAAEASGIAIAAPPPPGSPPGTSSGDGIASAFLVSTRETADDVRSGRPPRYRLFFKERQGGQEILREVQDSLFQMPATEIQSLIDGAESARAAEFAARAEEAQQMWQREQAARAEAARATETMPVPGEGPPPPAPTLPRMSTGGRF